jgi:hypothetical protein
MQGAWADLDAYAQRGVTFPGGKVLPIDMTAVDAGYHTDAAQAFCARRPNRLAVFGRDGWTRPILGRGEAISFGKQGKRAGQASKRATTAPTSSAPSARRRPGMASCGRRSLMRPRSSPKAPGTQAGRPLPLQPRHDRRMVRNGDRRNGRREDRQRLSEAGLAADARPAKPLSGLPGLQHGGGRKAAARHADADADWARLRAERYAPKDPDQGDLLAGGVKPRSPTPRRRPSRSRGGDWIQPNDKDWL